MAALTVKSSIVPLILSPKALAPILRSVKVLDATWFMPNIVPKLDPDSEYLARPRIPGALRWNPDAIAVTGPSVRNLPHMMPTPALFARECARRSITPDSHVVVYDTHGIFSSPRVAFTFHAFGHEKVSVLNGGLPAWRDAGLPLDDTVLETVDDGLKDAQAAQEKYPTPKLRQGIIRSYSEMLDNIRSPTNYQQVLDARPRPRFDGTAPEPRQGISSGHMPRALSLPFGELLETKTAAATGEKYTVLKDQVDLYRRLGRGEAPLVDFEKLRQASSAGEPAIIATCGSGMTAAIIWLAFKTLGVETSVYDESWMGWAGRESEGAPIVNTAQEEQATG